MPGAWAAVQREGRGEGQAGGEERARSDMSVPGRQVRSLDFAVMHRRAIGRLLEDRQERPWVSGLLRLSGGEWVGDGESFATDPSGRDRVWCAVFPPQSRPAAPCYPPARLSLDRSARIARPPHAARVRPAAVHASTDRLATGTVSPQDEARAPLPRRKVARDLSHRVTGSWSCDQGVALRKLPRGS